jgi:hypothetical protein
MIANALLAATVICLALLFGLMQACPFLSPYRTVLLHAYGATLAVWAGLFFVNVFAACYAFARTVFLKETGLKLAHLDKQLRTGDSISDELARWLSAGGPREERSREPHVS